MIVKLYFWLNQCSNVASMLTPAKEDKFATELLQVPFEGVFTIWQVRSRFIHSSNQWLTVPGSAPRPCGSRTRRAAPRCWGAGSAAGCPPPSRSPLVWRRACWPGSAASWWTWLRTPRPCSSRCSAWRWQTARCEHRTTETLNHRMHL